MQTGKGKLCLFVGIGRTAKFAVARLVETADRKTAREVLERVPEAAPCQVRTALTDNGIRFAEQPRDRNTIYARPMRFDVTCEGQPRFATDSRTVAGGIEHRLTKPDHPWSVEGPKTVRWTASPTNGQIERMNRTIKDATAKRFRHDSQHQRRIHLAGFLAACNFGRRLKTLSGLTPYEYVCKIRTSEPERFIPNPIHHMPGLNI